MGISLKPTHLSRYKDIVVLLLRYGRGDLVRTMGLEQLIEDREVGLGAEASREGDRLAQDLENMGPTYIKLGQLLSTRPDFIPMTYVQALTRLQDQIEPFPYEQVQQIIESELGQPLPQIFSWFEPVPLAAASLGQVHRAVLPGGKEVAVKVQRPDIREGVALDLEVLLEIAQVLDKHTQVGQRYKFVGLLEQFRKTIINELDYRVEARNLRQLGRNLDHFPQIVVPAPVDQYVTSRVLTMDYVHGVKITQITDAQRTQFNGEELADAVFEAYLHQILIDGFFHADPHPGNVFLTPDNRVALIDLGMVGRMGEQTRQLLLKLLLACSENRGEEAAEIAMRMGTLQEDFDRTGFRRTVTELVGENLDATVEQMHTGRLMLEIARAAGEHSLVIPPEIATLGKTLMNLDQVGRSLGPRFDPNASIRRHAAQLTRGQMFALSSLGNFVTTLMEAKDFALRLPNRVNDLLEKVVNNELRVQVDSVDEQRLIQGLQKIANRITVGLVLAALIIGAALLTQVPTSIRILGYPALAMILFLAAGGIGFFLVISILWRDHRDHRRRVRG